MLHGDSDNGLPGRGSVLLSNLCCTKMFESLPRDVEGGSTRHPRCSLVNRTSSSPVVLRGQQGCPAYWGCRSRDGEHGNEGRSIRGIVRSQIAAANASISLPSSTC